ncbi:UNKNOWN [Stylonychia lemnae]|uniref:Uncharacterized protein n=1 Tax=Stylonychia lemnae TaxID=5949 RepID=A0A078B3W5_STYLE|nr:UNKNOWN [Stylonychia lemnae]|eukprot:CDW89240.1 UNKNOWN [Stylonychia lemnae]
MIKKKNLQQRHHKAIDCGVTIQPITFQVQPQKCTLFNSYNNFINEQFILSGITSKIAGIHMQKDVKSSFLKETQIRTHIKDDDKQRYIVNQELASLIGFEKVSSTRRNIQAKFIDYCINQEIVDIKTHQYQIYKIPKMRKILQVDLIEPDQLFKYLKRHLSKADRRNCQNRTEPYKYQGKINHNTQDNSFKNKSLITENSEVQMIDSNYQDFTQTQVLDLTQEDSFVTNLSEYLKQGPVHRNPKRIKQQQHI